jgi:single-strand DNA-binding protein
MNQVFLIGRCGRDPDIKVIGDNNTKLSEFSVATSKPPRTKGDKWPTEWHNIKAWNSAADKVYNGLRKGDLVAVAGELKTENWEGQDGSKRYRTVIEVSWAESVVIEAKASQDSQQNQNDMPESW